MCNNILSVCTKLIHVGVKSDEHIVPVCHFGQNVNTVQLEPPAKLYGAILLVPDLQSSGVKVGYMDIYIYSVGLLQNDERV